MFKVLLKFEYDSDPLSGNRVMITDIQGNTPLKYRVMGTENVMQGEFRLPPFWRCRTSRAGHGRI